jgi:hypothetical protein
MTEQIERAPGSRGWVLWTLGSLAAAAVLAGGLMTLRALDAPPPAEESQQGVLESRVRGPKQGRKKPEEFGLPSYPGAFDHISTEVNASSGSAAFSVRKGTPDAIARFYIRELGAKGWQFRERKPTSMDPDGEGKAPGVKGLRAQWVSPEGDRELTLIALETPARGRAAQAVLSWR